MRSRLVYMVKQAIRHRCALPPTDNCVVAGVEQVDFRAWHVKGIRAIVFDFDGVLAAQDRLSPDAKGADALTKAVNVFGDWVFILSNQPSPLRIQKTRSLFPRIPFIIASRKKPYPDGLLEIVKITGCLPEQVMLIDDRLLTGGLAAQIAQTQFCYIKYAVTAFTKQPFTEAIWLFVRLVEKMFFWGF